jgi:tRNA modification GTPase
VERWRVTLLMLSAEAEVAIDYSDEEDGAHKFEPAERVSTLVAALDTLLSAPRVERLRDGVRIVVAGPPNAGKSSLVNALAGQIRAIVTAIPGTTRDLIEIPLSIAGIPMTLVDTAGLRATDDEVERIGIDLAKREIERADILLWLGADLDRPAHPRSLLIATKADLQVGVGHSVSTVTSHGVDDLKSLIADMALDVVPSTEQLGLNAREAELVEQCRQALLRSVEVNDPVLIAEELRLARSALDRVSGIRGVDQLLDALFSRFCLGK